jgi:hypothetical protein
MTTEPGGSDSMADPITIKVNDTEHNDSVQPDRHWPPPTATAEDGFLAGQSNPEVTQKHPLTGESTDHPNLQGKCPADEWLLKFHSHDG